LVLQVHRTRFAAGTCIHVAVQVLGTSLTPRVTLQRVSVGGAMQPAGSAVPEGGVALLLDCEAWGGPPVGLQATAPGLHRSAVIALHPVPAPWMIAADRLIGDRHVSVAVDVYTRATRELYGHLDAVGRAPASNEKLLLSMAALDRLGPEYRIPTTAEVDGSVDAGTVAGDLWLVGHGDPELSATGLRALAARIGAAGITHITGSVVGDTSAFRRDRGAPGWHPIALHFIGLPTALAFDHNADASGFVFDPEVQAAIALTADLRSIGVRVDGGPRAAASPSGLTSIARIRSATLSDILRRQNIASDNLDAETLSKLLAVTAGSRGSIAQGAALIQAWARAHGADVTCFDASGLSYKDRVTAGDMARLLSEARARSWSDALFRSLPMPGEGTLGGRLAGVPVSAKTGTLIQGVSALSGYVLLADGRMASFSILSRGLSKDQAVAVEDALVRLLALHG